MRQVAARLLVPITVLPDDVTLLYETVPGGDPDADTVWLFSQGGPATALDSSDLTEFPGHGKRILVNVHQVQTLNPGLIDDARLDSVARVQAEMDVSVEILDRVIRHFKARGKRGGGVQPLIRLVHRAALPGAQGSGRGGPLRHHGGPSRHRTDDVREPAEQAARRKHRGLVLQGRHDAHPGSI